MWKRKTRLFLLSIDKKCYKFLLDNSSGLCCERGGRMQFDWSTFPFQIQEQIKQQNQKIARLENELAALRLKVNELSDRPTIHVDTIEYKFDQLKVETLEGTLNIGLNPADAESLEELTINHENPLAPYLFHDRDAIVHRLMSDATQYFEKERPNILQKAATILGAPIDDQTADFVLQDLHRQLPNRINFYLDQTPIYERTAPNLPKVTERVFEKILYDIDTAVAKFLGQISPTNKNNHHTKNQNHWMNGD